MGDLIVSTMWEEFVSGFLVNALVATGLTFILWLRERRMEFSYVISIWLTIFYLCFLLEITLLGREPGSRSAVNLHFLGTYAPDMYAQSYMLENVLLFIPMGILWPIRMERMHRLAWVILGCFVASVLIETTQLVTERGYFQIDDIWLNVVGGMIGWSIWKLCRCVSTVRRMN